MSSSAAYASTPNPGTPGLLTTADTSWTAPSNVATVFTAGASGGRVDNLDVVGVASSAAGTVNFFVHDGSTYHLIAQVPVLAITASTTVPTFEARLSTQTRPDIFPIILKAAWTIKAAVTTAQTGLKVHARGGDF